jgi:hypothetical protein
MFSVSRLKNAARSGLEKLFPLSPSAPTAKTPGFQPGANPSALSHVVNRIAPDAAHPSPSGQNSGENAAGHGFCARQCNRIGERG